jgi:DNA-directed RNA polymerase subunit E'
MFELVECEDAARIPPDSFGKPLNEVALEQLRLKYEGAVNENLGYVIAIMDVKVDPIGRLIPGDGATYHRASFKLLTYIPVLHEVVEGEVVEVARFGVFIRVGPLDALLHVSQVMDDVVSYDERQGMLIGSKTQKRLKKGDRVRMRVTAISMGRGGAKIGVTTRQPFLGKLEWIEEEVKKLKGEGSKAKVEK